ncbi:MAG: GAF domain-containing sensor histidine kinase [Actinobacteria bacterium]|nr:GAF domain-containing sensor histidine kinase [Actinomycetota bacterium]MBV8597661.1 GAF domain-containing sensor histidine kinase [Actinomycetota bacterium]
MDQPDGMRTGPRIALDTLQRFARELAGCESRVDGLLTCVARHLNDEGFGFERVAVFKDGTGSFDPVPAAQHGFDDLEVLHGQLPPVEGWPLFRRALEQRCAVFARDAQLDGDVPLVVAGALRIRAVVAVPFIAGDSCLGLALVDCGGTAFEIEQQELDILTTAGEFVATALVPTVALEKERRTSELKSQFVALAAHELRAPVAGIHGVSSTLRDRGDDLLPEQVEILQRTLWEQSDRMRRLVDQLLDLSKLEQDAVTIKPRRFPVRARIESILRQVAPDRIVDVDLEVAPNLETVADPNGFDRIVANLVTNAFRYGEPPVRIAAQQLDTHFRLWVEDEGDGVSAEFAPKLFERFTRDGDRSDGGSGLGLAIAQTYARAQGGRLFYEDGEPKGARFQLVLPVKGREN